MGWVDALVASLSEHPADSVYGGKRMHDTLEALKEAAFAQLDRHFMPGSLSAWRSGDCWARYAAKR